jgi:hypothetical protein
MRNGRKLVRGSVKIVQCRECNSNMALFVFESETDVDSVGMCSATKCDGLSIIVAETTLDEWKDIESGKLSKLPSRLIDNPAMNAFHILHIKRIEQSPQPPAGVPFSEFRRSYKPPAVIYSCPCCGDGDAVETQEVTLSEFEGMGGHIVALGNLVVGDQGH